MKKKGKIVVVCGPMFSGKTSELLRRAERLSIGSYPFLTFKHIKDVRYSENEVVNHNKKTLESIPVETAKELLDVFYKKDNGDTHTVFVEEAQFFTGREKENIVYVSQKLKKKGINVILVGLDMDYKGKPFGPMPNLMAVADEVVKLKSVCSLCGEDAGMTMKYSKTVDNIEEGNVVEVGEKDHYEARCFNHWSNEELFS